MSVQHLPTNQGISIITTFTETSLQSDLHLLRLFSRILKQVHRANSRLQATVEAEVAPARGTSSFLFPSGSVGERA